jgi:hypothetical protein
MTGNSAHRGRPSWHALGRLLGALALTGLVASGTALAATRVVPGLKHGIVLVDVDHCNQTSTLCTGSGSVGPAADGNTSIVAVHIQLGTVGLAESAFALSSITNAAPGVTPAFVSAATCPACFAEPQPGVYRLAVRPPFGTWGGGSYVVLLTVTKPTGAPIEIVVPIDIPF